VTTLVAAAGSALAAAMPAAACARAHEQALPATLARAAHVFTPWGSGAQQGLRAGPVYLVAGSYRGAISRDGDTTDGDGFDLHRALIAVAPGFGGSVTVSGARLGGAGPRRVLEFSTDGATRCTVKGNDVTCGFRIFAFSRRLVIPAARRWRMVSTMLRIGRNGCFRVTATGTSLRAAIEFSVPGPDWTRTGWH